MKRLLASLRTPVRLRRLTSTPRTRHLPGPSLSMPSWLDKARLPGWVESIGFPVAIALLGLAIGYLLMLRPALNERVHALNSATQAPVALVTPSASTLALAAAAFPAQVDRKTVIARIRTAANVHRVSLNVTEVSAQTDGLHVQLSANGSATALSGFVAALPGVSLSTDGQLAGAEPLLLVTSAVFSAPSAAKASVQLSLYAPDAAAVPTPSAVPAATTTAATTTATATTTTATTATTTPAVTTAATVPAPAATTTG